MDLPKRSNMVSKRSPCKMICLMLFLVIVMMKIMSYTCQDLRGSINNNGVSKTVFSIPLDDLSPCKGKPNCYYQQNSKNCPKMTQLNMKLTFNGIGGPKPPPLIVALSTSMKRNRNGLFMDPYSTVEKNKPFELILCDKGLDMLEWAKTSVIANTSLPPALNLVFTIVYPDSKRVQKLKTAVLEFSSVFVVIFKDPPECVLVDDSNHKVFWSDGNRGTIEAYDTITNKIIILAKCLDMPRSMVIDSTLGLLFWCNFETIEGGSIERINFDGGNRMEITKGKYDLAYPETLGIDPTKRMLYWTDHQIIHTSDYYGNHHEILAKSDFYDPNFPGCFSFAADAVEHNFFWENHEVQHFNRSFVPNHLLSILYHKDDEALNNMKLPVVFSELHKWPQVKWRTLNVTCPIPIPKSHQCFLLPISLSTFSHLLDNRSLFKHKLVKQNNLNKFLKHDKPQKEIKWQVNSEIQTNLYYDPKTKHIQFLFYVVRDMNKTVVYKYKCNYVISYVLKNRKVYTSNLIILDPIEKLFYLLNTTTNWTKIVDFDGTNGRSYLQPNIFSYITQVMHYKNNAQSNKIFLQKNVLLNVLKIVIRSFL